MKKLLAILTLIVVSATLCHATRAHAADRPYVLVEVDTRTGGESMLGAMTDDVTCGNVAHVLNQWAQLPPVTPKVYVCRVLPVRT
jgi:hypothetical protein